MKQMLPDIHKFVWSLPLNLDLPFGSLFTSRMQQMWMCIISELRSWKIFYLLLFFFTRKVLREHASTCYPITLPSVSFSLLTLRQASHCVKSLAIEITMLWASPRQLQWRGSVGQGWYTTSPLVLQPSQYGLSDL